MGPRHERRIFVAAAVAGALCLSLVAAQTVAARVAQDPCNQDPLPHVTADGLHCGAIFGIAGHRTEVTPEKDAPPPCAAGHHIPGLHFATIPFEKLVPPFEWAPVHSIAGHWDYWTGEGKWVLWWFGRGEGWGGPRPTNVFVRAYRPEFHNWWHEAWPVRVYFRCREIVPG